MLPCSRYVVLTLRLRKTRICVQKVGPFAKAVTSERLKTSIDAMVGN